jgi:hypothetical protein
MGASTFYGSANKDGTATLLGIVTARQASGQIVVDRHGRNVGNACLRTDINSILLTITDIGLTPETQTYQATLDVAQVILDEILHGPDEIWFTDDSTGYNFLVDVPPSAFPRRDTKYRCVVQFFLSDGVSVGIGEFILSV